MKKIMVLFLAVLMMTSFLAGCGPKKAEAKVVDLKEIHAAIKEGFGEDYYPNMEMDMEIIKNQIGISEDNIESIIAESPMISVNIDTFIAVKAKEGKGETIEAELEKYRTNLVENSMMYPMNIAKANSAKVVRHGDYVFFLMFGKYDDRLEASDEERLEFAKVEIQKAEDIINKFLE